MNPRANGTTVMTSAEKQKIGKAAAHLFIAFALSAAFLHQSRLIAQSERGARVFLVGTIPGVERTFDAATAWKPRVFALRLAGLYVGAGMTEQTIDYPEVFERIARYSALWMLLTMLVTIYAQETPLPHMFGIYAAASLAYNPGLGAPGITPWDMPPMFFFAAFIAMLTRHRLSHLLWLAPLAVGFKETAMVLPVMFLFDQRTGVRRRLLLFVVGVLSCLAVKALIDVCCGGPVIGSMTRQHSHNNLTYLLSPMMDNPLLVNAGTLLVFLLLPIRDQEDVGLRVIALLFLAGICRYGNMIEYRIFFEMIPIALYALAKNGWMVSGQTYSPPTTPREPADSGRRG